MIVLKRTQDKVLCILQSIAEIVERRHTLPMLANVFVRKSEMSDSSPINSPVQSAVSAFREQWTRFIRRSGRGGLGESSVRPNGFFSASKANLRNAP